MFAQESVMREGSEFAEQHGVLAFILVAILVAIGVFVWRVWVFVTPLAHKWVETNIDTTKRNADSLELIGAAVTATEKSNELVLAKVEGVNGNVKQIQKELTEVKDKIETLEQSIEQRTN